MHPFSCHFPHCPTLEYLLYSQKGMRPRLRRMPWLKGVGLIHYLDRSGPITSDGVGWSLFLWVTRWAVGWAAQGSKAQMPWKGNRRGHRGQHTWSCKVLFIMMKPLSWKNLHWQDAQYFLLANQAPKKRKKKKGQRKHKNKEYPLWKILKLSNLFPDWFFGQRSEGC